VPALAGVVAKRTASGLAREFCFAAATKSNSLSEEGAIVPAVVWPKSVGGEKAVVSPFGYTWRLQPNAMYSWQPHHGHVVQRAEGSRTATVACQGQQHTRALDDWQTV
jgi:hypothetical protein